jgi:hypothetical protein
VDEFKATDWFRALRAMSLGKGEPPFEFNPLPALEVLLNGFYISERVANPVVHEDLDEDSIENTQLHINMAYSLAEEKVLSAADLKKFDWICQGTASRQKCFEDKIRVPFARALRQELRARLAAGLREDFLPHVRLEASEPEFQDLSERRGPRGKTGEGPVQ